MGIRDDDTWKSFQGHPTQQGGKQNEVFDALKLPSRERFWRIVAGSNAEPSDHALFPNASAGGDTLRSRGFARPLSPTRTQRRKGRLPGARSCPESMPSIASRLTPTAVKSVPPGVERLELRPSPPVRTATLPPSDLGRIIERIRAEGRSPTADERLIILEYLSWSGLPPCWHSPTREQTVPEVRNCRRRRHQTRTGLLLHRLLCALSYRLVGLRAFRQQGKALTLPSVENERIVSRHRSTKP